jgi:hypothetical protein
MEKFFKMLEPTNSSNRLDYYGAYTCPVCRHGEVAAMPLMEAFACNFCRHIFTVNLQQQILKIADSQNSLSWRWNGRHWQGIQQEGIDNGWGYGIMAIAFVLLPTMLVGSGAYYFPPLPGSRLAWLPPLWVFLTFITHLSLILWLIMEYYQFPLLLYLKSLRQRILIRS